MSELFHVEPKEPPTTSYSPAFERCWKVHSVGTKKTAWQAGVKNQWDSSNWEWLTNYLERRHKEDVKWIEGKYVPHLSSIINGERWTDPYQKVKKTRHQQANEEFDESMREMTPDQQAAAQEAGRKALEIMKELTNVH